MDDLFSEVEVSPPVAEPAARAAPLAPPSTAPPPYLAHATAVQAPGSGSDWPTGVPDEDEAESALVLALRGKLPPDAPLAAVAAETVAALSELERKVLSGGSVPFETGPIYRAAVMRLRMAAALSSAPPPPAAVDHGVVQGLLADLDALLAEVNPLAAAAPPDLRPSVEAIRNGLVRVAVDFSEVAHRLGSAEPVPGGAHDRPAQRAPQAARVISLNAGAAEQRPEDRRRRSVFVVFAAVLLAGAAFHGYRYIQREKAVAAFPSMPGAPDGMVLLPSHPGGPRRLMPLRGAPDRLQVEKFKAQQLLLGYQVTEQAGGVLTLVPLPPTERKQAP